MSFYDRKEVRDILCYLKLIANPSDEAALLRIVNNPPRGIGQTTVSGLLEQAVRGGRSLWDVMATSDSSATVNAAAADSIRKFQALILRYRERAQRDSLVETVSALIMEIGYRKELTRLYKEPNEEQSRWAAVEEVVNSLGRYVQRAERPTLADFLDEVMLGDRDDRDEKESQLARNAIALMTLHAAKGLEFPQVYLIGLEEGLLPHHRAVTEGGKAIEEERRLCYVGVTRAQDRLTMSLALGRMKWGKSRPSEPSRFLFEITGQADNPKRLRGGSARGGRKPSSAGGAPRSSPSP